MTDAPRYLSRNLVVRQMMPRDRLVLGGGEASRDDFAIGVS